MQTRIILVKDGDIFRALQRLEAHRPSFGVPASAGSEAESGVARPDRLKAGLQTDLRGWEWRYLWKQCQGDQLISMARASVNDQNLLMSAASPPAVTCPMARQHILRVSIRWSDFGIVVPGVRALLYRTTAQ